MSNTTEAVAANAKSPLDPADPTTKNLGVYTCVGKKLRSVALEIGSFTAMNEQALELPLHKRNIAALVNSGAQISAVTKEVVERLGLVIKNTEPATLQGFNNQSPKNKNDKVAEIVMGNWVRNLLLWMLWLLTV